MSAIPMPAACPRCGQFDMVQQVAGIVASQSSRLSWELRAPMLPGTTVKTRRQRSGMPWGCIGLALLLTLPVDIAILLVLAAIAAVLIVAITAAVVLGIVGYGVYRYLDRHVIAERTAREQHAKAETVRRYQQAVGLWSQLRYCYRCHGIFLPDNPWQHEAVTIPQQLIAPAHAWAVSEQLSDYLDRRHAPEVLRLDEP